MVGESRRSDNRGEAERIDSNTKGNLINILVVTIIFYYCLDKQYKAILM